MPLNDPSQNLGADRGKGETEKMGLTLLHLESRRFS